MWECLKEISNKKNVIDGEIVSIEIELERIKEHYFYILFNPHYFTPHDIMHYIWDISILENNVMCRDREKFELELKMKEICRWWMNE